LGPTVFSRYYYFLSSAYNSFMLLELKGPSCLIRSSFMFPFTSSLLGMCLNAACLGIPKVCSVASGYGVSTIAGLRPLYMGSIVRFPPVSYAFNALRARKV